MYEIGDAIQLRGYEDRVNYIKVIGRKISTLDEMPSLIQYRYDLEWNWKDGKKTYTKNSSDVLKSCGAYRKKWYILN